MDTASDVDPGPLIGRLTAVFEALAERPGLGAAVPEYPWGLNVFVAFRYPASKAAFFYTSAGSTITMVSYVDEYYRHELSGVFEVLGLE